MEDICFEILNDKKQAKQIAILHKETFKGFFLTFLGKGFLRCLYKGFISHNQSNVIIAKKNNIIIGCLAYSSDLSKFYKYLLKKSFIPFCWYAFLGFIRKPKTFFRLFGALKKGKEAIREEKYIELASICVSKDFEGKGIGTQLINQLKTINFDGYSYIKLETDAINNEKANKFYLKNGFALAETFLAKGNRQMNEYRYYL